MAKEDDQIEVGITFFMIQKLYKTKANKVIDNKKNSNNYNSITI